MGRRCRFEERGDDGKAFIHGERIDQRKEARFFSRQY